MKQGIGIKEFFIITRAWSLNLTFISVTLPTVFALQSGSISVPLYFFSLFAAMAFHLGANCLNDYFDLINKIDSPLAPTALCRPHPVFTNLLEPKELLFLGTLLLGISVSFGIFFTIFISYWIGALLVLGLFFAVFYTARPFGLKYIQLGELVMFVAFGPLMMEGIYCLQRNSLSWEIFYLSIPIGFLVAAVLLSNNLRDREFDKACRIKTLSIDLGQKKSLYLYNALCLLSFALILIYISLNLLPYKGLIIFLSLPFCLKNMREFSKKVPLNADIKTARFAFSFGVLLIISLIANLIF